MYSIGVGISLERALGLRVEHTRAVAPFAAHGFHSMLQSTHPLIKPLLSPSASAWLVFNGLALQAPYSSGALFLTYLTLVAICCRPVPQHGCRDHVPL